MFKEFDDRLKNLIEKNHEVTKKYSEQAKQLLDSQSPPTARGEEQAKKFVLENDLNPLVIEEVTEPQLADEIEEKADTSLETIGADDVPQTPRPFETPRRTPSDTNLLCKNDSDLSIDYLAGDKDNGENDDAGQSMPNKVFTKRMDTYVNNLMIESDDEDFQLLQPTDSNLSPASKAKAVTSKLLELQQRHKEISDRVQTVLVDTVDFAFGNHESSSIRDAVKSLKTDHDHVQFKDDKKRAKAL